MSTLRGANMTEASANNCSDLYEHRATARILLPLVYAVICPLGLLGNGLALHAIRSSATKINSSTLYSANLAVSDLLFCLALPLRAVYYALGFHWPLGEGLCKATALLFYLNSYAGINFMTCLAVDRFTAIVLRPWRAGLCRPRNVRAVCLFVWLLVLAQTLPLLSMNLTHRERNDTVTCMEYAPIEAEVSGLENILIGGVVVGYGVPLVIILTCYSVLSRKLQLTDRTNQLTARSGRTKHARGVVAGVVLVFVICFSPYHLNLLQYMVRKLVYKPDCEDLRSFQVSLHVTVCLMNFNACLDPFVYFFSCKGYKQRVLELLRKQATPSISSVGRTSPGSSGTHDLSCNNTPLDNVKSGR